MSWFPVSVYAREVEQSLTGCVPQDSSPKVPERFIPTRHTRSIGNCRVTHATSRLSNAGSPTCPLPPSPKPFLPIRFTMNRNICRAREISKTTTPHDNRRNKTPLQKKRKRERFRVHVATRRRKPRFLFIFFTVAKQFVTLFYFCSCFCFFGVIFTTTRIVLSSTYFMSVRKELQRVSRLSCFETHR